MLRMFKENTMVVVDIGYRSVILNREDAMKFVEILEKAEMALGLHRLQ